VYLRDLATVQKQRLRIWLHPEHPLTRKNLQYVLTNSQTGLGLPQEVAPAGQ
jgi:hypothetical protein